jgi:hypothetical protein
MMADVPWLPSLEERWVDRPIDQMWPVFSDYEIRPDRRLAPKPGSTLMGWYTPAAYSQMLVDFSIVWSHKLRRVRRPALLTFCRRWGMLGFGRPEGLDVREWQAQADPLAQIAPHARAVRLCMELLYCLQENETEGMRLSVLRTLGEDPAGSATTPEDAFHHTFIRGLGLSPDTPSRVPRSWKELAQRIVAGIVGNGVAGLTAVPHFHRDVTSLMTMGCRFGPLTDVLYWHLGGLTRTLLKEDKWLGLCRKCGRIFEATKRNQIYCGVPDYVKERSPHAQSGCGQKFRRRMDRPWVDEDEPVMERVMAVPVR